MRRIHATLMTALALFIAQNAPVAFAGPGSGGHGGKMALCFFENGAPDLKAKDKYFEQVKMSVDDPGRNWRFKSDDARAQAKGHFTASLLELASLTDAKELDEVWAKRATFEDMLKAMLDEFRLVPKFYRLLESAHPQFPRIADDANPLVESAVHGLQPIDDSGDFTNLPDNCVPVQAAMRQGQKLDYDPLIWETASTVQRAALQLHEEVYSLGARLFSHDTSLLTQQVIRYLAQGKVRPAWKGRPCLVQGLAQSEAVCAQQDDLSSLLSDMAMGSEAMSSPNEEVFGYYPPLYSLNALRGALQQNISALHGALHTVGAYCEGSPTLKNAGVLANIRATHASLSGLVKRIYDLAKFGDNIWALVTSQNGMIAHNAANTSNDSAACPPGSYCVADLRGGDMLSGVDDREDPEVTLVSIDRLLQGVASRVSGEMAHVDPNHLFSSHHAFEKKNGAAESYCLARKNAEERLKLASERLDALDFLWDSTLPPSTKLMP